MSYEVDEVLILTRVNSFLLLSERFYVGLSELHQSVARHFCWRLETLHKQQGSMQLHKRRK